MKLKILKVLILILMTILLGSCRNFIEPEDRLIVLGLAADYENDKYTVTVEVVDNEESSVGRVSSKLYTASGMSLFDANRNLIKNTGKRMFWGHTKIIIISRSVAAKSLYPIIDWINPDQELRADMKLLVSQEKTAKEIFECKAEKTSIITQTIIEILKNNKSSPKYPDIDMWEFIYDLSTPGIEAIAPVIKKVSEEGKKKLEMSGTAVFLSDSLIGFLNENESMNLLFVRNKLRGGAVHLDKNITKLGTDVVIEIYNNSTKIKPRLKDGKVTVEIDIKTEIGKRISYSELDISKPEIVEQINNICSRYLEEYITKTIKGVQESYKSDIFGFGRKVNISLPSQWKNLKADWDNNFSKLDFIVKVDAEISTSGLLGKPIKEE